jgi:hypothetical protein
MTTPLPTGPAEYSHKLRFRVLSQRVLREKFSLIQKLKCNPVTVPKQAQQLFVRP